MPAATHPVTFEPPLTLLYQIERRRKRDKRDIVSEVRTLPDCGK